MLLGTLLNVVADSWLRVSQANAEELGKQAAPPPYVASLAESPNPMESWNAWLRQTVRSAVIGGPADQAGRVQCSESPDLLSLIKEMETRQRKWHSGEIPHPLDQPPYPQPSGTASSDSHSGNPVAWAESSDEKDLLCLRVVGSARKVISRLNFEPHEYPDGMVS